MIYGDDRHLGHHHSAHVDVDDSHGFILGLPGLGSERFSSRKEETHRSSVAQTFQLELHKFVKSDSNFINHRFPHMRTHPPTHNSQSCPPLPPLHVYVNEVYAWVCV